MVAGLRVAAAGVSANGRVKAAGILANKHKLSWRTKRGEQQANFFGSITQASTLRIGQTANLEEVNVQLNAVVPMACIAAAGIAAMIAEAFTAPGEKMPIAPLGARLAHRLPVRRLRIVFALMLLALAVRMLANLW